jgi:hypothetical protein
MQKAGAMLAFFPCGDPAPDAGADTRQLRMMLKNRNRF